MKDLCRSVSTLNERLLNASPREIMQWAVKEFGDRLILASSFGAEDVVLIDILSKVAEFPRVFLLDTGRLHQETYDVVDSIRARYGIEIETYFPHTEAVQDMVRTKGVNSFYGSVENRKECCCIRKVEPLARALASVDAWITGLRRRQSVTRADLPIVEIDESYGGILKINPLANWTQEQIWEYIHENDVPYNKLHDAGFPSIGCAPCTRAIQSDEDIRTGRWWWESPEHKECGLHIKNNEVIKK